VADTYLLSVLGGRIFPVEPIHLIPGSNMFRIPKRGRHITQEPQTIAHHLLGAPLATFRRRFFAFLLDVMLFGVIIGALFVGFFALDIHRKDPTFFPRLQAYGSLEDEETQNASRKKIMGDLAVMILERCPEAFPEDINEMVATRNWDALDRELEGENVILSGGSGNTRMTGRNPRKMIIGMDFLLGEYSSFLSWGAFFVGWFTLWSLVTRGRSPGKAVFRLRVMRLDGKALNFWDCFSRAGGYGASAATLMLGFLEAIWHPNRQAIHDRIAGTVVVRG
jgi:uncharacterized RDD family membrane protein YckC